MATTHEQLTARAPRRAVLAGPLVAVGALALAYVVTQDAGVPLRDPDGVASERLVAAFGFVGVLVVFDVLVRAARRTGSVRPSVRVAVAVLRERWTRDRIVPLCFALFGFFSTYFAYRNLKSVVPLQRPGTSFDDELTELERGLFGDHPAELLQSVLGTGLAAHALSAAYLLLFVFIPFTLAMSLVFSDRLEWGLFYVTALSLNWIIGAGSYYVLPSLGPFAVDPQLFAGLPATAVSDLQDFLWRERVAFLTNPQADGAAQSIGAFASLHVSIFVTGALAAHLLGLHRAIKAVLWLLVAVTVLSTVYFGWHYLVDDLGGVLIAVLSLALARFITGLDLSAVRRTAEAHG